MANGDSNQDLLSSLGGYVGPHLAQPEPTHEPGEVSSDQLIPTEQVRALYSQLIKEATTPTQPPPMPNMGGYAGPFPPIQMQPTQGGAGGIMQVIGNAMQAFGRAGMAPQQYMQAQALQEQFSRAQMLEQARLQREGVLDERSQRQFKVGLLRDIVQEQGIEQRTAAGERATSAREKAREEATTERERFAQQMETQRETFRQGEETKREKYRQSQEWARQTDKDRKMALKVYGPALDSLERYEVMKNNVPEGNKGNQQADVSLVANHIGMTLGLQRGARITRAVWEEAMASAPWMQRVQARFDERGYLSGVVLTPQQRTQMLGLAKTRYEEDVRKARREATLGQVTELEPKEFRGVQDATGGAAGPPTPGAVRVR